ncbi:MAG: ATP-binding protein [Rhodospirillales bacterium]
MLGMLARWLVDPSGLTPHGFCLSWEPGLIWLYAVSDATIGLAYFSIPLALAVVVYRRRDLLFKPLFLLFAAFILLCGTGHWLDLLTLWVPAYGIEGLVNGATAIVSVVTAVSLWMLLPQALTLPSPMQLRDANDALATRDRQARDLAALNADLQQFAYVVSHDLKAPLRAISLLADWIGEDMQAAASAESIENFRILKLRVSRMDMLIDSLLTYVRAGHANAPAAPVNLNDMVAEIAASIAPPPGFVVRFSGDMPIIHTCRTPLEHVLQNLISNAIKHNDRPIGEVAVSASMLDGTTEIRVADDGPGIAPEFHTRIFTIFQTLQCRDETETSGVGLSIVKKIIERVGGRVWVESAPPERGASFVFTWPAHWGFEP